MTGDYPKRPRGLDEIYALIDKNRVEAAKAAQAKFHNDMEAARNVHGHGGKTKFV